MGSGSAADRRRSVGVRRAIADHIATGSYPSGSQLPAEPVLATEFGVSRATLREALRSLEDEGLLTRTPGSGTFVTRRSRVRNNLDVNFGVTEAIRTAGMEPGTREGRIEELPATEDEAHRLGLAPGDPLLVVERVRTADGRPVVFSRDLLPCHLLGGVRDVDDALSRGSVYDFLTDDLGLVIHYGVASFRPATATAALASRLEVERGSLLLYLRQVDYEEGGRPILYSHEFHVADAFEFNVVRRGPWRRSR